MDFVLTAIAVQCIGTGLVAFFLWQLGRAIRVRFVTSWALAAATFGVALVFLYLTVATGDFSWTARAGFGVFMAGSYLMAFLFWSGLREYSRGEPFTPKHLLRLAPLLAFAGVAPWLVSGFREIVPYHFCLLGGLFVATLTATRVRTPARPSVGKPMVQASLAILSLLMFGHAYSAATTDARADWNHGGFAYAVVSDALAELLIVFGTVILACERVRDEFEANNRALEFAKMELETAARTDGLTGLLNRRAYDEWPRLHAAGSPSGCVAAIDVNDLKQLNDSYLHAAGDAALKLVGRALMNRFRVTDPIFRIGGDEFAIIMPGGSADELARRLGAIDGELENLRLPGVPGPYTLRIAWGVAAYSPEVGLESAIEIADREMYAQKARRKIRLPATLDSHGP